MYRQYRQDLYKRVARFVGWVSGSSLAETYWFLTAESTEERVQVPSIKVEAQDEVIFNLLDQIIEDKSAPASTNLIMHMRFKQSQNSHYSIR